MLIFNTNLKSHTKEEIHSSQSILKSRIQQQIFRQTKNHCDKQIINSVKYSIELYVSVSFLGMI